MSTASSSPHRDCAVQTSSRLTLVTDDAADAEVQAGSSGTPTFPCDCTQSASARYQHPSGKSSAARRHFGKYEPQQLQEMSDELGWDCGICLDTAEDPCVTRCGHLYCQSHLNHWLSTHPSCPVCKTLCTSAQDVVPIFSRGRTSPVPSSIPSSPISPSPDSEEGYHDRDRDILVAAATLMPQSCPGSPATAALRAQWPDLTGSECNLMSDYDITSAPEEQPRSMTPPIVPPVPSGIAHSHSPIQPHPHPLMTSYIIAHYLGIALRIVGVGIILGMLLR